jgi:hypothetical protein
MTKIKAEFKGNRKDLEMFLNCGISEFNSKFLGINKLMVEWVIDEENYELALENCMGLVNTNQMELWNINFISIN